MPIYLSSAKLPIYK